MLTEETKPTLSIVVPMYNEGSQLYTFYSRVRDILDELGESYEIVCVNDGSSDNTLEQLVALCQIDSRVKILDLSRNFGKEIAISAGIDFASGEAVIPIDADLQDPPELIPKFVEKWREGFDVVYGTRIQRDEESWLKRATASSFYYIINKLANVDIPKNAGDFRLVSRPAVEALKQLRENHRFMRGLFSWIGFKQVSVPYRRPARSSGRSKYTYWKMWNFALEGITSFSYLPLQMSTLCGLGIALLAFVYGAYIIAHTLVQGSTVPGYPSLMVVMLLLGGIQLIFLGIIGEYLARTYLESKRRPLYFVKQAFGFSSTRLGEEPLKVKHTSHGSHTFSANG